MFERDDGIRSFEAENVADGKKSALTPRRRRLGLPAHGNMGTEGSCIGELPHLAFFLHGPIPGELSLGLRPRLLRTVPTRKRIRQFHIAGNLRSHANVDSSSSHFR